MAILNIKFQSYINKILIKKLDICIIQLFIALPIITSIQK